MAEIAMPSVSFIVARSRAGHVIGCENQLPWRLRTDLRRFRQLTTAHPIIMGRKTFDSIGKPLPNRLNIILSRDPALESDLAGSSVHEDGLLFVSSPEMALMAADKYALYHSADDLFVIGGEQIYNAFLNLVNTVYLTEVDADVKGDAYFNIHFSTDTWKARRKEVVKKGEHDEYSSIFYKYENVEARLRLRKAHSVSSSTLVLSRESTVRSVPRQNAHELTYNNFRRPTITFSAA